MPENRKYFINKSVILVTARTEDGLPFVPNYLMELIIWGILAQAQTLYPVRICSFVFMANHFHLLLVVDDPENIPKFVGYLKAELAHAVNRLCGRRRKTIWCEGYDSPTILTAEDAERYLRYIYLNPAKANLVESIEQYPGVSSWKMLVQGKTRKRCKRVPRDLLRELPSGGLSIREQRDLVAYFEREVKQSCELVLEPFAWLECFQEFSEETVAKYREQLISTVKEEEQRLSSERRRNGRTVVGSTALRRQSMFKEYNPKKFSKKMICICSDIPLRKQFIAHFKHLAHKASRVFQRWKIGDFSLSMPPGMFAPASVYHSSSYNLLI